MATWSSFQKDKLVIESWREFIQEEEQKVYGINSEIKSESLYSLLKKSELLSDEQTKQLSLFIERIKKNFGFPCYYFGCPPYWPRPPAVDRRT